MCVYTVCVPAVDSDNGTSSSQHSGSGSHDSSEDILGGAGSNHGDQGSSGYHSSGEQDSTHQQHLSSLELENKLLRQEVDSLNQEMQSVIHRAQAANEGIHILLMYNGCGRKSLLACLALPLNSHWR